MRILTLFLIVLTLATSALALPPQIEVDRLLLKAKASLDAGDFEAAIESLESGGKLNVKMPETYHFHLGKAYSGAQKWDKAILAYEKYLEKAGAGGKFYKEALEEINRSEGEIKKLAAEADRQVRERERREAAQRDEADLWSRASAATDSATVQRYLDRYPTGTYAAQASIKMADVKAAERNRLAEEKRKQLVEAARGLEWTLSDNGSDINWNEATNYCASKGSGWRLPTGAELQSLYDPAQSNLCRSDRTCKVESKFRLTGLFFWTNQNESSSHVFEVHLEDGTMWRTQTVYRNSSRALCVRRS